MPFCTGTFRARRKSPTRKLPEIPTRESDFQELTIASGGGILGLHGSPCGGRGGCRMGPESASPILATALTLPSPSAATMGIESCERPPHVQAPIWRSC